MENSKSRVIFMEDDPNLAYMLKDELESEGFTPICVAVKESDSILTCIQDNKPDLVLLDVNLAENVSGFEIGRRIRTLYKELPIIFTTARTHYADMQEGYSLGCVDYVKKPYTMRELMLHVNEMIRRNGKPAEEEEEGEKLVLGNLIFMPTEFRLMKGDEKIILRKNENLALRILYDNKGQTVPKDRFTSDIWNEPNMRARENSLNNLMCTLRAKLEKDPQITLLTIPKGGYKLVF